MTHDIRRAPLKALVTGATGFVGSHLVEELLRRGAEVRCTVRSTSKLRWLEGRKVETVKADLSDAKSLRAATEGIDTVFHVAGLLRGETWDEYRAGNFGTTKNLLDATRPGTRFLFASSLAAAGPSKQGAPSTEEQECAPISMYGKSKWEAESEVWRRRDQFPVTVVRPPVVYGPRDEGLLDLFQTISRGVRPDFGTKHVSIVQVEDLARGIADAAGAAGVGQVFYVSNPEPTTFDAILDLIQASIGRRAIKVPMPDRVVRLLGGVVGDATRFFGLGGLFTRDKALEMTQKYWVCSAEKAKKVLGWSPRVAPAQGIRDTVQWYRAEGLI